MLHDSDDEDMVNTPLLHDNNDNNDISIPCESIDDAPKDVIDDVYKSMHSLMKALTTDNLIRDSQIQVIKSDIDELCDSYSKSKSEIYQMINNNTADIESLTDTFESFKNNDSYQKNRG